jgi:hypothetical protein
MIGCWHALRGDEARQVLISLGAHVGGHELVVEHCHGEHCWHWAVLSLLGHEIEAGTAPDAHSAERLAEEAAFHLHPPMLGDWVARLM